MTHICISKLTIIGSWVSSCDIHLRAILEEMCKMSIIKTWLKNYTFDIVATSTKANELNSSPPSATYICISELGQHWFR